MKNLSQATVKNAKPSSVAPAQKGHDHAPLPINCKRISPIAVLAGNPFAGSDSFEIELDWIGDTMEPEIYQGNLARVVRRENMWPCLTEIALGLLKNARLVFGAFNCSDNDELLRIDFINPEYASVFYRESDFQWLYPVETISQLHYPAGSHRYRRIVKTIVFERGDEVPSVASRERLALPSKSK